MVAGRYQAMFSAWQLLPFRNPIVLWQIISHKYLRPFIPVAMALMLVGNLLALVLPVSSTAPSWFLLLPPFGNILLGLQVIFYLAAMLGRGKKYKSRIGRLMYLPTFLLNSNLAALLGLYRYLSSRQTVMWKQVREDL